MRSLHRFCTLLAAAFAVILMTAVPAQSQGMRQGMGQGRAMMSAEQRAEAINKTIADLGLEGDLVESVRKILADHQDKNMELMTSMRQQGAARVPMTEMREKMRTLELENFEALAKVLSEEQMEKFKEIRAQQMSMGRRGPGTILP